MDRKVEDKVRAFALRTAEEFGFELFDLGLSGSGSRTLLRVMIDKEGGITLNDCEAYSRRLEAVLDVEDPIAGPYTLEVSSPGLDRPLKNPGDFGKNIGKLVRVVTKEKMNNQSFFLGRLEGVNGELITLSLKDREEKVVIPFSAIAKAKLEIEIK